MQALLSLRYNRHNQRHCHVKVLQQMLVSIWQENICNYLGFNDVAAPSSETNLSQTAALAAKGYILENGHWTDSAEGGGGFCRLCVVSVKEVKHWRLKKNPTGVAHSLTFLKMNFLLLLVLIVILIDWPHFLDHSTHVHELYAGINLYRANLQSVK